MVETAWQVDERTLEPETLIVEMKVKFIARHFASKEEAEAAAPDDCDDCVLCLVESYIEDEGIIGFLADHDVLEFKITRAEIT